MLLVHGVWLRILTGCLHACLLDGGFLQGAAEPENRQTQPFGNQVGAFSMASTVLRGTLGSYANDRRDRMPNEGY